MPAHHQAPYMLNTTLTPSLTARGMLLRAAERKLEKLKETLKQYHTRGRAVILDTQETITVSAYTSTCCIIFNRVCDILDIIIFLASLTEINSKAAFVL